MVSFKIEPVIGDIRTDAVFGYKLNGKGYVGVLEVEISNKGFDFKKYQSDAFKKIFSSFVKNIRYRQCWKRSC